MLSVIIPSHNDIYLHKTIDSLLDNAADVIEVIPVIDGYAPGPFRDDRRIRPQYHTDNRGMREAINTGVAAASGEYLMRSDEHCMFGPGYDRILLASIQPNWIVTPRRYKLDPVAWRRMDELGHIDYEKLIIKNSAKKHGFSGVEWCSRAKERADVAVDETLAMQGSCWVMPRSWWDSVIVRLDSVGYGTHYQDTTEMLFKTWQAGGHLMVNKNTWFAHKHRDFPRTHTYGGDEARTGWKYALTLWMPEYIKLKEHWGI